MVREPEIRIQNVLVRGPGSTLDYDLLYFNRNTLQRIGSDRLRKAQLQRR